MQDVDSQVEELVIRGKGQLIHSLVERRVGVDVGTEAGTERLEYLRQVIPREPRRPVEHHVLEEVRDPGLAFVLVQGPSVDGEAQLGTTSRGVVVLDEVPQSVLEFTSDDIGIERKGLSERRVDGR